MGPLHHRCFHANSFPQKRLTQLYVGRIRACALDLWRTDPQRRATAKKGAEGHSKFLFQQVTSAILLRLWQNLRSNSQSPLREGINDSGYQEQGVGPGVEPDRKTVRQGLDNEARRTGYRGGYSRDSDRLARARPGSRSGRTAAWARGRNLRPRIVRQDHARTRMYRRGAKARRGLRLYRRGTCARRELRAQARRQRRGP